jgi:hypothetical protein
MAANGRAGDQTISSRANTPATAATHRFAWDGLSFRVPADWNLSACARIKDVWQIDMEDDYAPRMSAEWTTLAPQVDPQTVRQRYAKAAGKLLEAVKSSEPLQDLPAGWSAFLYTMPDDNRLLTAYRLPPAGGRFAFFSLHFPAGNAQSPRQILDTLIESFTVHDEAVIPWQCYDLAFNMPREFKLAGHSFLAGRKNMVFQWRMRRFYLWQFSLAEEALKKQSLPKFAADFLNSVKGLRGPRFEARGGAVVARQRLIHPLGHMDQFKRLCLMYHIGFQHDPERNQIFLWLFHHRWRSDLKKMAEFKISPPSE